MPSRHRPALALAVVLSLLGALALSGVAMAAETTLTATLEGGAAETPPGDPDGSGSATIRIDPAAGTLCWSFTTQNVGPGTQSHIHVGAAGVAGPVHVPLDVDGFQESSEGCITPMTDMAPLQAILDNPAGYYVNVHTADFPAGAVRGQLAAASAPNTALPSGASVSFVILGLLLLVAALVLGLARRRSAMPTG